MRDVLRRPVRALCGVLALMLMVLGPLPAAAQVPDNLPLAKLEEAFRQGSVNELMERAAERLEMAVGGSGMLYSRGQAVYVMDKFFREHPPRSFSIEGVAEAGASWFATGSYLARGEERRYHVYLRLQRASDAWELIEIRISSGGAP